MTLRRLTAVCGIAMTITLMVLMMVICRRVLLLRFQTIEREHAEEDLNRAVGILRSKVKDLGLIAKDYSAWDSTYEFMKHPNESYIRKGLSNDVFDAIGIRFYALVDPSGNIALIKSYGSFRHERLPPPDVLSLFEVLDRPSLLNNRQGSGGVIALSDGLAIISMQAILPTSGKGPSRGTLILVRMIDNQELLEWSSLAQVRLTISAVPSPPKTAIRTQNEGHTITILSESSLAASALIRDIFGRPCVSLGFVHDRTIWLEGVAGTHELLIFLGIISAAFGLIKLWLVEDFVIFRIEKLSRLTRDIRGPAGLTARATVGGNDEIALLGHQMNAMLDKLENANYQLLATQEHLKFEATHDHLTGVLNRASAVKLLERELQRSGRDGSTVAVIMVDADHFKQINDNHGHAAGDRVLQQITQTILGNLRSFDVLARYGGEEFLIVAPNCRVDDGASLARRILERLESTDIEVDGTVLRVTASVGLTAGRLPWSAGELIVLADRALYRAKRNGRNCVEVEYATGLIPTLVSPIPASS